MVQEIMIDGERERYSLTTEVIRRVLGGGLSSAGGRLLIYRAVTLDDVLEIVYRGLYHNHGLTWDEFRHGYKTGVVFTSRRRGHYSLWQVHGLVMKRVRAVNRG